MARALDQILQELHAVYNPQRDQYNQALSQVDPQQQAEEQGLQSAKTDAFSQIETAANRRGVFYGGMPIAEEQRYTGQNFLPSLANMRSKYAQQKFDLTNALHKVTTDEYSQADSIRQTELDRDEKQREFDTQMAAQEAASRRASAGGGGAGTAAPTFGASSGGASATDPIQQLAYNDVYSRVSKQSAAQIKSDYLATLKSAQYGNAKDKYKIQLYNQLGYSFNPPTNAPILSKIQSVTPNLQTKQSGLSF